MFFCKNTYKNIFLSYYGTGGRCDFRPNISTFFTLYIIYVYIIPTGPVIADPFISPFRLTITPALSNIFINIFYLRNNKTFRLVF